MSRLPTKVRYKLTIFSISAFLLSRCLLQRRFNWEFCSLSGSHFTFRESITQGLLRRVFCKVFCVNFEILKIFYNVSPIWLILILMSRGHGESPEIISVFNLARRTGSGVCFKSSTEAVGGRGFFTFMDSRLSS